MSTARRGSPFPVLSAWISSGTDTTWQNARRYRICSAKSSGGTPHREAPVGIEPIQERLTVGAGTLAAARDLAGQARHLSHPAGNEERRQRLPLEPQALRVTKHVRTRPAPPPEERLVDGAER